MLRSISMGRLIGAAGVLALVALVAVAGPILGKAPKLPGTLHSLSRLKKVKLFIFPVPQALKTAGISEGRIRRVWRERLKAADIQVATGNNVPTIMLGTDFFVESDMPDVVAILGTLMFQQQVHVKRINMDLEVPTYSMTSHMLVSREGVGLGLGRLIDSMAVNFISSVRRATEFSTSQDE